jgi:putative heme-binding domain-containing protein
VRALAKQGTAAVPALAEIISSSRQPTEARLQAVWAATRIGDGAARATVRTALADPDEVVRQAALHSVSVWRDRDAVSQLVGILRGPSPALRRVAAEALGRIGAKEAVPALLAAARGPADRFLEHSIIFALVEIADRAAMTRALESDDRLMRRAAIIGLDQMPGGQISAAVVGESMRSPDPKLRETAWWVAGHHPDWGMALRTVLHNGLSATGSAAVDQNTMVGLLARYATSSEFQTWMRDELISSGTTTAERRVLSRAMALAELKTIPPTWVEALASSFAGRDASSIAESLATIRAWRLPPDRAAKLLPGLRATGLDQRLPTEVRLLALAAIPGGVADFDRSLFEFLGGLLHVEQFPKLRSLAAEILGSAQLNPEQKKALAALMRTTGPTERQRLLPCFQKAPAEVAQALLDSLSSTSPLPGLRPDDLKDLFNSLGPNGRSDVARLIESLRSRSQQQQSQIEQLLRLVPTGDPHRGKDVFFGAKAACSSCHQVAYLGGNRGPALTQIGAIRTEADLIESILTPSVTIAQGFEPWTVATKDGKVFNGLLAGETSEEMILATATEDSVRLRRDEIEAPRPSTTSIMPDGMGQLLTQRELTDLVAFLKTCK